MTDDEPYEDCDRCGERYTGEDAIRSYLRDVEVGSGASRGVDRVCIGCLEHAAKKARLTPNRRAPHGAERTENE